MRGKGRRGGEGGLRCKSWWNQCGVGLLQLVLVRYGGTTTLMSSLLVFVCGGKYSIKPVRVCGGFDGYIISV